MMTSKRQCSLIAAFIVFLVSPTTHEVFAQTPVPARPHIPVGSVPASAKITLELDKPEYFLGENILLHFVVENVGEEPFSINLGGDYRGSHRSLRFRIVEN